MNLKPKALGLLVAACLIGVSQPYTSANATPFSFSTGDPDGRMAAATRPGSGGSFEIETGDDFILTNPTTITSATFTGLVPAGASVSNVVVEVYRVFPLDSDTNRTPNVPTRANSPSDVAFDSRSAPSSLIFQTALVSTSFLALNSVLPGGIHAFPNQTTMGNGPVRGNEVQVSVTFTKPLNLPADHYFFVPQVTLDNGSFLWLSAPRPITGGTGPFTGDLQAWTRDQFLDPDWLRIGTDIVGGTTPPTFAMRFSLTGVATPIPAALPLFATGLGALGLLGWRRKRRLAI